MNKYKNKKCVIDGYKFDSLTEGKYYEHLKLLKASDEITNIELQPEFIIRPSFTRKGKKYRAEKYKADFKVTFKSGLKVIIDVKGMKNRIYLNKRNHFLYKHDIEFWEVSLKGRAWKIEKY